MKNKVFLLTGIIAFFVVFTGNLKAQSVYDQLSGKINYVVDINGTGDFVKVQDAINAIPDDNDTWKVIFVKKGVYYEKVILGHRKTKVILVGEDADSTVITYDDYANKVLPGHTFSTYTFRADANDFQAYNISFESTAGGQGQGVAFHSNGDRQILYHCKLLGNQDTYFDNFRTRRYIKDCFIEGNVDYIFGFGVTLFDSCQVHTNASTGYITAASTPQHYEFGYVFKNCRLTSGLGVRNVSLGRPWFDWSNTIYYECWEPESIIPGGWTTWSQREKTCIYQEYNCFGPGSDTTNRVYFGKQLDPSKAPRYNIDTIFSARNFPSHLGYDGDTSELMHLYRRFEKSGYPERADTILYAGRDHYPEYPTENWKPVFYDDVYQVIKNNTYRIMDSINGEMSIDGLLIDGLEFEEFDPLQYEYVVELDKEDTTCPFISLSEQGATVNMVYPTALPGYAKVTALSKDKVNGATYNVYFSKDSAYWDTDLRFFIINSSDTIHCQPDVRNYQYRLRPGTNKISSVGVYTKVTGQNYLRTNPVTLPGIITVEVTAVDKVTKSTYEIFVDLPSGLVNSHSTAVPNISLVCARNNLMVVNQYDELTDTVLEIFNLKGGLEIAANLKNIPLGATTVDADVSELKCGVYLYSMKWNGNIFNGKFHKLD
ncbi:MAG: hypothetical protein JXB00_06525 [Bacteroidales bacterium]|nr:hypothetical protein [Bacteroidales bacterium]